MTAHCTCGVLLPEGARFCHKCGKPQFEELAVTDEVSNVPFVTPSTPPPTAPAAAASSSARSAATAAIIVTILMLLPLPPVVQPVWLMVLPPSGGFLAVYLFVRRSGASLSALAGARLGWLTGVFSFVFLFIPTTLALAAILSNDALREQVRDMAAATGQHDPTAALSELGASPMGVIGMVLVMLLLFVFATGCAALGGAVAAKVLERD